MIVAFVPNLFDRSRFGDRVVFIDSPSAPEAHEASMVLVDLDRCDEVAAYRVGSGATVIGFGSHVDTEARDRALDAGYDKVLARSAFFRQLPDLLTGAPAERDATNPAGNVITSAEPSDPEPIGTDHES